MYQLLSLMEEWSPGLSVYSGMQMGVQDLEGEGKGAGMEAAEATARILHSHGQRISGGKWRHLPSSLPPLQEEPKRVSRVSKHIRQIIMDFSGCLGDSVS